LQSPEIAVISSMAKGFGVPAAVLVGNKQRIGDFEMQSESRVHCSPPSVVALRAMERALQLNASHGDILRARLASLVCYFRLALRKIGLQAGGGLFPVQTIFGISSEQAARLHQRLSLQGIRTVLHRGGTGQAARISFLINAGHRPDQINEAVNVVSQELQGSTLDEMSVADEICTCS
jgi:8-amino-7-oxononanoate synthase